MPIARFQMPDGRIARFEVADGTTPEQAQAMIAPQASALIQGASPPPQPSTPGIDADPASSAGAAMVETPLSIASGALATPIAGIAGLAAGATQGVANMLGMGGKSGVDVAGDVVRNVQDKLTYHPQTSSGKAVNEAISSPFQKLADHANAVGGDLADKGYPLAGALENTGLQSLPMLIGAAAKVPLARKQFETQAALDLQRAQNATRDKSFADAKAAGFVIPPTTANPGSMNLLEGAAGKIKTQQTFSVQNAATAGNMVRNDFSLPPETALGPDVYKGIRDTAGNAYAAIPNALPRLYSTPEYEQAINNLSSKFSAARQDFPEAFKNAGIEDLTASLDKPGMSTQGAIDMIKKLRADAQDNYKSDGMSSQPGRKALAEAQTNAAGALENLIDSNLRDAQAPPELMQNYRDARATIAKSYIAERATNPATGTVDPGVLAKEISKGTPLTGGLAQIGQAALAFPKAFQNADKIGSVNGISKLELAAAVTQPHGYLLAAPSAARAMILSKWYQNRLMPNYSASSAPVNAANALTGLGAVMAGQRK